MRGLDTRVLLARARCMALHDADRADMLMVDVYYDAEADGYIDAENGIHTPPLQFAGEPSLLNGWQQGWNDYWLALERSNCGGCDNSRGDPCPIHG